MWNNNIQQELIQKFTILVDDERTCNKISAILQSKPDYWTDSIVLQYSLSAEMTATRTLTIKTDHFQKSQLIASLKNMNAHTPERFLTSDDANRLIMEIMDNVVASQVVDGEYVPDSDELTLKDAVTNSLQLVDSEIGDFSQGAWDSVFWDPDFARPDRIASFLNKVLKVNQGNHTVQKSSAYSEETKGSAGIDVGGLFSIGGSSDSSSSSSSTFGELEQWLLQHNYDVEIQGDIFVAKNLTLQRLNLGVLDRQETIFTKNVQMRRVDAPGTMKVTAGVMAIPPPNQDAGIGQMRKEIESLSAPVEQLEGTVDQLEPQAVKLEGQTSQLEGKLGPIDESLKSEASRVSSLASNSGRKVDLGSCRASCSG